MTEQEILQIFKDSGALLDGHFVLTSGNHSPHYIEKFRVLEHPKYTEQLCKELARMFEKDNVTLVVGPMTGGILLAYEVGKNLDTKAIFTERVDGKMKFRRGFEVKSDDRVLIVEDILDTGRTFSFLVEHFKNKKPKSLKTFSLLDKPDRRVVDVTLDYRGFIIPDVFIVGYGMDYLQKYRQIPFIGELKPEVYSK